MGSDRAARRGELEALRLGIELGMTLIDTAEMYGDGASEQLVGEAIREVRDQVFLVSKVLPSHAGKEGVRHACEASLKRLGVERIDLYLLHWRGHVTLGETIDGFEQLRRDGMIGDWGVSNFDVSDMQDLVGIARPQGCLVNQVLYNLDHRGIEFDLLRYSADQGVPLMAYSPVGQGGELLDHPVLAQIARRHGKAPAQIALAWTLLHPNVISIPKAASVAHVRRPRIWNFSTGHFRRPRARYRWRSCSRYPSPASSSLLPTPRERRPSRPAWRSGAKPAVFPTPAYAGSRPHGYGADPSRRPRDRAGHGRWRPGPTGRRRGTIPRLAASLARLSGMLLRHGRRPDQVMGAPSGAVSSGMSSCSASASAFSLWKLRRLKGSITR